MFVYMFKKLLSKFFPVASTCSEVGVSYFLESVEMNVRFHVRLHYVCQPLAKMYLQCLVK